MEQRLYDAAAKLPATNAKLDTSQMTGKIRATNSIGRVVITLAACAAAMCIILFGALSLASSVKEYNDAVAYFSMHNLSTDGLTRTEIKAVYKDIISGSFTHPKTADVLASKDNTEPQPTDPIDPQPTEPTDPNIPVVLPEYVPGSIKLAARDAYTMWAPKDRQYRASYYLLMGNFANIVRNSRPEEYEQWKTAIDDAIKRGEWKDEMLLVTYIKHFDIPRATMEAALYSYTYNRTPLQLQTEFYEAPNLDIIYTFDNEIINRYYRYELAAADPVPQSNLDPVTGLPIGVPEGFVFAPQDAGEIAPLDRKYRVCYYQALGPFASLGADRPDEKSAILNERWEDVKQGIYRDEMWLVSIIKGLNIPREEFDRAVAKYLLQYDPEDLMTEYYEIPNGDIIYTFDNELINAYYRYEEPDWDVVVPQLSENKVHMKFDGQEYHYVDWHIGPDAYIYRDGYYMIWGEFLELANNRPGKSLDEWVKLRIAEADTAQTCNEAALVSFLKYFEVPKEDFEAALEKYISRHTPQELDWDYHWVLPDADIIYTFDNEVINQYYRKEDSNATNPSNPTVPNPTEPTDPSESVEPTDPEPTEPGPTEPCTHVWGQWIVVAEATCDQSGKQERSCDYCDEKQTQEIPKREHEESDWIIDKPADVGVEGHKHTQCIYCNLQMREETIPAITADHSHSDTTWITTVYPGCTTSGSAQLVCSCGEIIDTKEVPPSGHKEKIDKAVAATCVASGLTEGKHCSVCNAVLVAQQKVPATGHSYKEEVVHPTPTAQGYTLHRCVNCGDSYKDTYTEFSGEPTESLIYKSNGDGTCSVVGISDSTVQYVLIPEKSPAGDKVVGIANNAFQNNKSVFYVDIPNTVTYIGQMAFDACENLETVIFPKTGSDPLTLGTHCFRETGVVSVDMTQTYVESISNDAFSGCKNLKTVKLNGVKTIGDFAFLSCTALESVIHTGELEAVGARAFESCKSLKVFRSEHSSYNLDTILYIYDGAFSYSAICDIVFHEDVLLNGTPFSNCINLKTVDCSQMKNAAYGFNGSTIEKIYLRQAMTEIYGYAFTGVKINEMIIPDSVTRIRSLAFKGVRLEKLVFGAGLTEIQMYAFKDANITTYDFSKVNQPLHIGIEAFANNTFTSFAFPDSTVSIGSSVLKGCDKLQVLTIPFIGPNAEDVNSSTDCLGWLFGESVDCWEQDEYVPKSLKTLIIHGDDFGCRSTVGVNLTQVVIGKEVTWIGEDNFSSVTRVFYEGTEDQWNDVVVKPRGNEQFVEAEKYFYSETKPTNKGNYWYYDEYRNVTVW